MDGLRLWDILKQNENKSFVQRILNREKYPVLQNPDGSESTHSMASGESDGRFFAYPTVLMTKDGLKRFSNEEAFWFGTNYKNVWAQEDSGPF